MKFKLIQLSVFYWIKIGMPNYLILDWLKQNLKLHWLLKLLQVHPEVFDSNSFITEKVDIYGFGMILYELMTFQAPFPGMNMMQRFMENTKNTPKIAVKSVLSFGELVINYNLSKPFAEDEDQLGYLVIYAIGVHNFQLTD